MFGRVFKNHDCPELTKIFLNAITLSQTFNDDFTFVRGGDENVVPLGKRQTKMERWLQVNPACELIIKAVTSCSTHKIDQQETDG